MVTFSLKDDKGLIRESIINAGKIAKNYFKTNFKKWEKSPNNPVTEADYEVNKYLLNNLGNKRINYGWLSEESEERPERLNKNYVWIIDPIDGTKAFIDKKPEFTISIALVHMSKPLIGAIYNPITEELFEATKGEGAYLNEKKIFVSSNKDINKSHFLSNSSLFRSKKISESINFSFVNSIAYRMALVAKGDYDATVTLSNKSDWDIAAGDLLVSEAGGVVTSKYGKILRYNKRDILHPNLIVANKHIHKYILNSFIQL